MGLFTGLIRLQYLNIRRLDLEYKVQTISMTAAQLALRSADLVTIGNDLDPDSAEYRRLESRREKLHLMEKRLEAELLKYNTLLKSVNAEIESAQKIVDTSIKRLCTYAN
jgi:hypothetical protein